MDCYGSFQSGQSKSINIAHVAGVFREALSEHEILAMNDLLLSNGLHTIVVKNVAVGRTLIETFLTLLNQYQQIYWLSHDTAVPPQVYDLYACMKKGSCLEQRSIEAFECYFYEAFYGDLLIIECTQQLMDQSWYPVFEKWLHKTCVFNRMPVVQLLYDTHSIDRK